MARQVAQRFQRQIDKASRAHKRKREAKRKPRPLLAWDAAFPYLNEALTTAQYAMHTTLLDGRTLFTQLSLMNNLARSMFPDKAKLFDEGKCTNGMNCKAIHKKVVTEQPVFRNPQSEKEYKLSGLCQPCQDEFFGK